jgi:hypothetical protein
MPFAKKKEGSLRPCIDYWKLNQGTINDKYPLPWIMEALSQLLTAKYISKIDFCEAYSLIEI